MISWPIAAAIESQVFDHVMVSTDDKEIAALAESAGAWVPYLREQRLSDDVTTTASVTVDALHRLSEMGYYFDYVCCLYPTAVFTTARDLSASYQAIVKEGSQTCLAVTPYPATPFRAIVKGPDDRLSAAMPSFQLSRTQDLPKAWHDAGQFCWSHCEQLIMDGQVSMADAIGHEMKMYSVVDIDEEVDFLFAEKLFILKAQTGLNSGDK